MSILPVLAIVVGCAQPAGPGKEGSRASTTDARVPTRLVASIFSDPTGMHQELTNRTVGSVPGLDALQQIMNAGLSYSDDRNVFQQLLAEALPSTDSGLWQVFPDGRMETTWHLKPNLVWHDGMPFTSDDLAFAMMINRDKELGFAVLGSLDLVEGIDIPDPRTAVIRWAKPFIEADTMFSAGIVSPLPKHVLQQPYSEDKASLFGHPFWREEYVGVGPFRLQEWVPGSHLSLIANDAYVLGRPRIDQMEVRFITEFNTVVANLLAGATDIHLGRGFGVEQLLDLRTTAPNMQVQVGAGLIGDPIPMFPQFMNTDPPVVANLDFRRALLRAIDRQEMTDTINYGLAPTAHTWLQPDRVEFRFIEGRINRYEYDLRSAAQTVESLGYARGADGVYRDAGGQKLHIELRTTDQRLIQPRSAFSVGDYWKRFGIDIDVTNVPNQLIPDREYRSQFPAFELVAGGVNQMSNSVQNWLSTSAPTAETRFVGGNRARYRSPELDGFIQRYVTSIPVSDRMMALGDVIHHQSENLTMMTLFYEGSVLMLGSRRLRNVTNHTKFWNTHLWEVE
jgi:peptide/nickel transport system substrate-binding protein